MKRLHFAPLAAAVACMSSAQAQELWAANQSTFSIMRLSAVDGSLIDPSYVDVGNAGTISSPNIVMEAREAPNGELYIPDLGADVVFRFSGDGTTYLGEFGQGLDNVRSLRIDFGRIWVANFGTGGAGYGTALVEYDMNLNFVASHPAPGSPWGILTLGNQLLTTDATNNDLVLLDPTTGTFSTFHDSNGNTGINFPYHLNFSQSGTILCCGFLGTVPSPGTPGQPGAPGIYEYDTSGNQINYYDTESGTFGGPKSVYELLNGNFLFTTTSGAFIYDTTTNTVDPSAVVTGSIRMLTPRENSPVGTSFCNAVANSTGQAAAMAAFGSATASDNDVTLSATQLPPNQFAIMINSLNQGFIVGPGGSQGNLCLSGNIGRYNGPAGYSILNSGASGNVSLSIDLTNTPQPSGSVSVMAGETWNFQAWYRDVNPGATNNFTDGVSISFQ